MAQNRLATVAAPHITSPLTTRKIMVAVTIALCPTLVASAFIFGLRVLLLAGVTVASCVIFEYLYQLVLKKPITIGDFSAVVTGLILAFNLPPAFPLWMACIGSFVAIVITKQLFGGIGFNFANPALVGRIVLQLGFPAQMMQYTYPASVSGGPEALASATPLAVLRNGSVPLIDLLLGTHGGTMGETVAVTLILGGVALILFKVMSASIPVVYIGGTFVLKFLLDFGTGAAAGGFGSAVSGAGLYAWNAMLWVLSGGLLLGAFFMATDYVTSPYTLKGKIVFGIGLAVITVAIRTWSHTTEGVSYAILIMNLLVPFINSICLQKPLGATRQMSKKRRANKEVA
ncbi:MAG: RnfABCDGE type electron transport complex subunit D [Oscillospiraceae bacterium]